MLYRTALGIVLRDLRIERDLRMRDVATKSYMSYSYLSEVERGKKEITSGVMFKLCEALDTNVPDVLDQVSTLMRETIPV
jgi:transcriptional regulator with XRE-family HTH domain